MITDDAFHQTAHFGFVENRRQIIYVYTKKPGW